MTLNTQYSPKKIEEKWYDHWMEKNYFRSLPDEREPYSIVIPPPNVTGVLHMGHMLNNTIQDILIRKARLEGKNACWVPGTDHASIATEAKVVKMLRERGIKKSDISRAEFLKYAFEWKDKYGGIILEQLKKLGASCDWERTRFTMEESLSKAVIKVFIDLHKKGKIYRGLRMTNWDPEAKTVLSNEEVIFSEENSKLYYVRYKIEGTEDEWITIATTRPETILGDTAVAVNPDDKRYTHLKDKKVTIPMVNRSVPIIFDRYVEMEFGTGALKVTPAHDQNDYEIGQRHNLEVIDTFNPDGTMSEAAQFYIGEDRFVVRKKMAKELEALGHIVKIENYNNKVGRSERTNAIVEPRLTLQWFMEMKGFAKTSLDAVRNGDVTFFPEHFINMYQNWLNEDNIRDWCISRQLWWGQRIPAYYYNDEVFVAETPEKALEMAKAKTGITTLTIKDLSQDEDVVDTWFSSWLWPISVFDGFDNQDEFKYYYPTNVLVTGWDIIFFWVARMIMAGYEYSGDLLGEELTAKKGVRPFKHVYFTGMVRDQKGRKMSKQLGNSPDALKLIEDYGADGVRFGMLFCSPAGGDLLFDEKLCEQGSKFCNKMWNATNLVKGWKVSETASDAETQAINQLAGDWFENKLNKILANIDSKFDSYRLSEALQELHSLLWNDFFSWYLEIIKPAKGNPIDKVTYDRTVVFYEKMMTVLHPFMPFVTEEIWHQLRDRKAGEDCVISNYPQPQSFDDALINKVEKAKDVISKVREIRQKNGIGWAEPLSLFAEKSKRTEELYQLDGLINLIKKMAMLSSFEFTEKEVENTVSFLSGTENYYIELNLEIDVEAERERLTKELEHAKGFLNSVIKKLSNDRFVSGAPAAVVEMEKKKLSDGEEKIKILEDSLAKLN